MRASLTIGGIEVALSTPAGALEAAVAERYAPFLGAVEAPVCSLTLEANQGASSPRIPDTTLVERLGETTFQVVHPGLSGWFDLAGAGSVHLAESPYALDNCLRVLFGLLAPRHDALMLHATSVISNDGAHVFIGPAGTSALARLASDRPVFNDGLVLLRQEAAGWLAASTPFWATCEKPGPPHESALTRLCILPSEPDPITVSGTEATRLEILKHTYLPTADPGIRLLANDLARGLTRDVQSSDLRFAWGSARWNAVGAESV
jgi:hypothetical protein